MREAGPAICEVLLELPGAFGACKASRALAFERDMAEKQHPGSNRVLTTWFEEGASGTYVPENEETKADEKPEKKSASKWSGPIIDLRTRGGGKKRGGPRRR